MGFEDRVKMWDEIYSANNIKFTEDPSKDPTIVVEDSYQSGATLWSYAKYLKQKGSPAVHAIACVKTMRDTDNK